MTDLAALGAAHAAGLAHRVRREVVMEQERILGLADRRVDDLRITHGAQGGGDQRLGLAAGEQRRAVGARQHAHAHADRTHVVQLAAVDAHLGLEHAVAHGAVLEFAEFLAQRFLGPALLFGLRLQFGHDVGLDRGDGVTTLQLVVHLESLLELVAHGTLDCRDQRLVARRRLPVPRRLAGLGGQLADGLDGGLHLLVAEHHRAQHDVLAEQVGFRLHHEHRAGGTGHDQVQIGAVQLGGRRVEHVLAVDVAHARGADRALEGRAGQGQRRGGADQGRDVAVDLGIERDHGGHDLDFVLEVVGEQRAHRTVDQARGQRLLLGRTPFALEETAGDAAGGVELFLVIDGEREEALALTGLGRGHGADQHHGSAHAHHHRAGRLAGDFARLQRDLVFPVLE